MNTLYIFGVNFQGFCFDLPFRPWKSEKVKESDRIQKVVMDNDRELTFTTLSGAANSGEQTFIVEQPVSRTNLFALFEFQEFHSIRVICKAFRLLEVFLSKQCPPKCPKKIRQITMSSLI